MWQRFDEKARVAVFKAQENAMRFRCEAIDPDLLFLGCLDSDRRAAEVLLASTGLDLAAIRTTIESQSATRGSRKVPQDMTLTIQGKSAIDKAFALNGYTITVAHLVVGIAGEETSCLNRELRSRGITPNDLKGALADVRPSTPPNAASGITAKLANMQPLDALAIMTIREIKLNLSQAEANRLQALADGIDQVYEVIPSRSGADPIAETMADAVHLASSRREPLGAAHLLAAMYRRVGSIVNIAAPPHYASPEEMMDRLVKKDG